MHFKGQADHQVTIQSCPSAQSPPDPVPLTFILRKPSLTHSTPATQVPFIVLEHMEPIPAEGPLYWPFHCPRCPSPTSPGLCLVTFRTQEGVSPPRAA
jgi:hypothetical protein